MILQRRLMWGLFLVTIMVSVLYVRTRFLVIQLSYEIRDFQKKKEKINQKKEMYELQLSMLKSPSRVQELAASKLGLSILPNPHTTIIDDVGGPHE